MGLELSWSLWVFFWERKTNVIAINVLLVVADDKGAKDVNDTTDSIDNVTTVGTLSIISLENSLKPGSSVGISGMRLSGLTANVTTKFHKTAPMLKLPITMAVAKLLLFS